MQSRNAQVSLCRVGGNKDPQISREMFIGIYHIDQSPPGFASGIRETSFFGTVQSAHKQGGLMNKLTVVVSMLAGLALQSVANAGQVFSSPVQIFAGSSTTAAAGNILSTFVSSDKNQFIGCGIDIPSGGFSTLIICEAESASGQFAICTVSSPSPTMLQAVAGINEISDISFSYVNNVEECTSISVSNFSYDL
jgi:hypothetical protein